MEILKNIYPVQQLPLRLPWIAKENIFIGVSPEKGLPCKESNKIKSFTLQLSVNRGALLEIDFAIFNCFDSVHACMYFINKVYGILIWLKCFNIKWFWTYVNPQKLIILTSKNLSNFTLQQDIHTQIMIDIQV